jgi:hypothetical protein
MCSSTERTRSPRSAHPPVLLLLDGEAIDAARYIERDLTGDSYSGSKAISLASCSHDRRDEVRRANDDRTHPGPVSVSVGGGLPGKSLPIADVPMLFRRS